LKTNAKSNCSITKKKSLAMTYVVRKLWHYLLGNVFTFFIDHKALLYLVNKPIGTRRITKWLLFYKCLILKYCINLAKCILYMTNYLKQNMVNWLLVWKTNCQMLLYSQYQWIGIFLSRNIYENITLKMKYHKKKWTKL